MNQGPNAITAAAAAVAVLIAPSPLVAYTQPLTHSRSNNCILLHTPKFHCLSGQPFKYRTTSVSWAVCSVRPTSATPSPLGPGW
ncbi:hypothetical protein V8E52_003395 [Russula decolorans]